jgi:hypothetical protein
MTAIINEIGDDVPKNILCKRYKKSLYQEIDIRDHNAEI